MQALIQSLQQGLQTLHATTMEQPEYNNNREDDEAFLPPRRNHTEPNLLLEESAFMPMARATTMVTTTKTTKRIPTANNLFDMLENQQQQQPRATTSIGIVEPILWRIQMAQGRLHESSRLVTLLAAPLLEQGVGGINGSEREEEEESDVVPTSLSAQEAELPLAHDDDRRRRHISNLLNLLSTFLYLTNYYIAAPTSGQYAAKLSSNGSTALAGLVMGMTPTAALAGTLLYSYWTSFSYKYALVFAACMALVGNVLYATALVADNFLYVLAGRLLIGFGSCRSINRRYIADAYGRASRTAAAAAFVTAGSLGMAVGPAMAAALQYVTPPDASTSTFGKHAAAVWWTVENAPGWVMTVAWTMYLVVLLLYFCDPPRGGQDHPTNAAESDDKTLSPSPQEKEDATSDERQSLLSNTKSTPKTTRDVNDDDDEERASASSFSSSSPQSYQQAIPVVATLIICFLLKMTLECLVSSTATVTAHYFDWDASSVGVYLALQGLSMFPANVVVAHASLALGFEDCHLILWTAILMTAGTWGILNYSGLFHGDKGHDDDDGYTIAQYTCFGMMIFVAANALEGPNMSLLSKSIPKRWSRGFFNMGLLATEAGTFGRTVGDLVITWFGTTGGIESMLNHTFLMLSVTLSVTVLITYKIFPFLEPRD